MTGKAPKRPKDANQLAKRIVDLAVFSDITSREDDDRDAAARLGRRGGLKGGKARAEKLSPERRKEIAVRAAKKRWNTDG